MKLLLLYSISTLIAVSINAAILPETQHITKDLNGQIAELYRSRDVKDSMNAAAEYFRAPQASKQNLKTKTKERLASAAEYFKAPDASKLRSNALILAQERLAAAAEYLKAPEFLKRLSETKVNNARAAAAEYFRAPESLSHNTKIDRTAERLTAAAEYLKAPEFPKRLSGTKVENVRAAGAEYFRAPESPSPNTRIYRTAENLTATAEYFKTPESQRHNSKIVAAKHFRIPDYYSKRRKYLVTHGGPMFRPTRKAHRRRYGLV